MGSARTGRAYRLLGGGEVELRLQIQPELGIDAEPAYIRYRNTGSRVVKR